MSPVKAEDNLQTKFFDHIKNKKVIQTYIDDDSLDLQKKNYIKIKQLLSSKKKITISAYDKNYKTTRKQLSKTKDHLKENSLKILGVR